MEEKSKVLVDMSKRIARSLNPKDFKSRVRKYRRFVGVYVKYLIHPNPLSYLFLSLGLYAEAYFSFIFWNTNLRFFRDLYYYSLSESGFSSLTLIGLITIVPLLLTCCRCCSRYYHKMYTFLYVGIFVVYGVSCIHNHTTRIVSECIALIFLWVWFDTRIRDKNESIRSRFKHALPIGLIMSSVVRFSVVGHLPFYSHFWYIGLINYLLSGSFSVTYMVIENVFLFVYFPGVVKRINRLFLSERTKRRKKKKTKKNSVKEGFKCCHPKENCNLFCLFSLRWIRTAIPNFLLSLSFVSVLYFVNQFVIDPGILGTWCGLGYDTGIIVIFVNMLGVYLTHVSLLHSPLLFCTFTLACCLFFITITNSYVQFAFGLATSLSVPICLKFVLDEFRYVYSRASGGISLGAIWYYFFFFMSVGIYMDSSFPLFGDMYGGKGYAGVVWSICLFWLVFVAVAYNRVRKLYCGCFCCCVQTVTFPHVGEYTKLGKCCLLLRNKEPPNINLEEDETSDEFSSSSTGEEEEEEEENDDDDGSSSSSKGSGGTSNQSEGSSSSRENDDNEDEEGEVDGKENSSKSSEEEEEEDLEEGGIQEEEITIELEEEEEMSNFDDGDEEEKEEEEEEEVEFEDYNMMMSLIDGLGRGRKRNGKEEMINEEEYREILRFEKKVKGQVDRFYHHIPANVTAQLVCFKTIIFIISIFVFLPPFIIRCTSKPKPYQEDNGVLRVCTYNVFQGYTSSGLDNLGLVVEFIEDHEIDLIALQETNAAQIGAGSISVASFYASSSSMFLSETIGRIAATGLSVMSNFPILSEDVFTFEEYVNDRRMYQKVEIPYNGTTIHFINAHLDDDDDDENEIAFQQIKELIRYTDTLDGPIILVGGFNSEALLENRTTLPTLEVIEENWNVYEYILYSGYRDAFYEVNGGGPNYSDYYSWEPKKLEDLSEREFIDHVFYKSNGNKIVTPKDAYVYYNYKDRPSDHYPVIVDFEILS